jgi:hypothetical protein
MSDKTYTFKNSKWQGMFANDPWVIKHCMFTERTMDVDDN